MPSTRSGARLLVDQLLIQGVNHAFCVPGESYLAVLDALYDAREMIKLVINRHESGATFMADAYAKLTGQPGVVFVTRGPGACNAAIGIHTAFQDSTPLVVFVGQVGSNFVGARGVPGSRLPADVRPDDQVGRPDRSRGPRARTGRPRVPDRDERTARARRPGAARGHAAADGGGAGRAVPPAGPRGAERHADRRAAPADGPLPAPCGDPRRNGLDRRRVRQLQALRRGELPSGRLRVPLPGPVRQPAPELHRRRRHRHQSEARAAHQGRRPRDRRRRAPGRDDDLGLHAPRRAAAGAVAGPRARRAPRNWGACTRRS